MTFWYVLHPLTDGRWRWALHLKQPHPTTPIDGCLNAGAGDTRELADIDGQRVLYTCLKLMTLFGVDRPTTVPIVWDLDPFAGRQLVTVDTADGATVVPV